MRVTIMHAPQAGDEEESRDELEAAVAAAGHEVRYMTPDDPSWPQAPGSTDLVVVVGGDGTVASVFLAAAAPRPLLTVLPRGSANNIARTAGFGDRPLAGLAAAWASLEPRRYDVGRVQAGAAEARFAESMGGGATARVLVEAAVQPGEPSGAEKLRNALALWRETVLQAPAEHWRVGLDGRQVEGSFLGVVAMNVRELGPNVPFAPRADPGDGMLDVVLLREEHRLALAAYLELRLRGRPAQPPDLQPERAARVELWPPPACPLHVDDETWPAHGPAPAGPLVVSAGREQLCLVVP
jgi:diacylglycerol kinase family enzyme